MINEVWIRHIYAHMLIRFEILQRLSLEMGSNRRELKVVGTMKQIIVWEFIHTKSALTCYVALTHKLDSLTMNSTHYMKCGQKTV